MGSSEFESRPVKYLCPFQSEDHCSVRLVVRTHGFHPCNSSSTLLRSAKLVENKSIFFLTNPLKVDIIYYILRKNKSSGDNSVSVHTPHPLGLDIRSVRDNRPI